MKILVDADSCQKDARELILRAVRRKGMQAIFAANHQIPGIEGENITMEICPPEDNSADNRLAELAEAGDLGICRDLALAKRLLEKGAAVIDDRGREFTHDNINELLSMRDFMVSLAENNLGPQRTANYSPKDRKSFADTLDRLLVKMTKN